MSFVVCAQFTGEASRLIQSDECDLYLGENKRWSSLENAVRFETREAAENAMQEKWERLRITGNKSVVLSVLELRE
ncbi:MAG: hypothetical protein KY410_05635 [Proteobacteria bacterium]|nr:hypothetical protein [Pseudomonadota bacterium]